MKAVKFSVAAAAALALSLPATVMAADAGFTNKTGSTIDLSGDFRVRGHSLDGYNPGAQVGKDRTSKYYDTRFRLKLDAKTESGVSLHMQSTMLEADLGIASGANVPAGPNVWNANDDDYAYVAIPLMDGVTVSAGRIIDSFSNGAIGGFASGFGLAYDTVDVAYDVNDDMTVGFWTVHQTERSKNRNASSSNIPADDNEYALYVQGKAGDWKYGAQVVMAEYQDDGSYPSSKVAPQPKDTVSGTKISAYGVGKIGDFVALAEIEMQSGDVYEKTNGKGSKVDPMGVLLAGVMPMGDLTVAAAVAMAMDGYVASKYFTPSALFGKSAPTALMNFGEIGDSSTALVVPVSYKITDSLTAKATLAQATIAFEAPGAKDLDVTEIDLGVDYKIGKNFSYYATLAQGTLSDKIGGEDSLMAMTHGLLLKF